jgi:hypothetical protein
MGNCLSAHRRAWFAVHLQHNILAFGDKLLPQHIQQVLQAIKTKAHNEDFSRIQAPRIGSPLRRHDWQL